MWPDHLRPWLPRLAAAPYMDEILTRTILSDGERHAISKDGGEQHPRWSGPPRPDSSPRFVAIRIAPVENRELLIASY